MFRLWLDCFLLWIQATHSGWLSVLSLHRRGSRSRTHQGATSQVSQRFTVGTRDLTEASQTLKNIDLTSHETWNNIKIYKTFIHHTHHTHHLSGSVHPMSLHKHLWSFMNSKLWVYNGVQRCGLHRPKLHGLTQGPEKQPVLQDL